MRYLGIDYGDKKVGLALSDEEGRMGFPHETVTNTPRLLQDIGELIARERVGAVVFGESTDFSGHDNPIMKEARPFARALAERAGVPVYFEPETFTSAEARRAPHKLAPTRKRDSRDPIDASAAALILTSYLSRHGQAGDHD